jgi:hypothetical protein
MEKVYSSDIRVDITKKPYNSDRGCRVYKTLDNEVLRVFPESVLKERGEEIERRLSNPIEIKGVLTPRKIVYVHNDFIGYTTDYIETRQEKERREKDSAKVHESNGIDLLKRISEKYIKLEKIVKDAGEDIVFPLLFENAVLEDTNGNIFLPNYEDIQIGDDTNIRKPSLLEDISPRLTKYGVDGHYTKELDKLSLTHYYIRSIFGRYACTSARALKFLGLPDDIIDIIIEADDDQKQNKYLGERVLEIAENYAISTERFPEKDKTIKRLILKDEWNNSNK